MIKVLVIDDSAIVRKILSEQLQKSSTITVVGTAPDPYVARNKIEVLNPDVLTLDLELPRMDGITFLRRVMKYRPMPVIVVSSLTPKGSELALEALEAGAVDVVCKPGSSFTVGDLGKTLVRKIEIAATAAVKNIRPSSYAGETIREDNPKPMHKTTDKVVAIGASTGGTEALKTILRLYPADGPGTLIVQHMPESFMEPFAKRLNDECEVNVKVAQDGERVQRGLVLLAPGNKHMVLRRDGARYRTMIKDGPLVFFQRPSVEVLFQSVAQHAGENAVGVILTGMGADGAKGLRDMFLKGAQTIAQDENTCVVFGMPKAAIEAGGVKEILPLGKIGPKILDLS